MSKTRTIVSIVILTIAAAACSGSGSALSEPQATATPTPPLAADPLGDFRPETGLITLEFIDAETQLACTSDFPFSIDWDKEQAVIAGAGEINCPLSAEQCGEVCLTYHIEYLYQGSLRGDLDRSALPGELKAELILEGTLTQYWTDIPPDSVVAFTEENPMVFQTSEIIPLIFDFEDGAVFTIQNTNLPDAPPWVFTLHMGK